MQGLPRFIRPRPAPAAGRDIKAAIERLENRQLMSAASLDPNFGNGGEVVTSFNAAQTVGQSVATDASGRIIVAAQENNNVAVIRYLPTAALDPQFGTGGKAIVPLGQAVVRAMAIQTNGKILVCGSDGSEAFVKKRLTTSGARQHFRVGRQGTVPFRHQQQRRRSGGNLVRKNLRRHHGRHRRDANLYPRTPQLQRNQGHYICPGRNCQRTRRALPLGHRPHG